MLVARHIVDVAIPVELRHAAPHAKVAQVREPYLEVVIFGFESLESAYRAGKEKKRWLGKKRNKH